MNDIREKQLKRLGLDELGVDLRAPIGKYHSDQIVKFIRNVIKALEASGPKYTYYPLDTDVGYLAEYYDYTRHEVMGDIAVQIEINSITQDFC